MEIRTHRSRLQFFKTSEGYKMGYVDEGTGPAILLIHGVPTSSYLYRKIIPLLSAQGRRVIAPDLLGYGASEKPRGYDIYASDLQAQRLGELMLHLRIDQWTHVCHDMGGLVTWSLLDKQTSHVSGLVLLNTIIYQEGFCPPIKFRKGLLTRLYTELYCSRWFGPKMIAATFNNGTSKIFELSPAERDAYTLPMKEGSKYALHYFFSQTGVPLPDVSETLKKLNIPVKVIWGAKDEVLVWKNQADRVMRDLRMSPEHVYPLPVCRHFIQEEEPQFIARILLSF